MSKILDLVIEDMKARETKGLETYGVTMDRKDLSRAEWMQHLYEELLDAILYIKKHEEGNRDQASDTITP